VRGFEEGEKSLVKISGYQDTIRV